VPSGKETPPRPASAETRTQAADKTIIAYGVPGTPPGTPNGVFEYADTPVNREARVVGLRVRYQNQYIGLGGFPAEAYYGGSAAGATVEIDTVTGGRADYAAADRAMRQKVGDPNWKRPSAYSWNHAGGPGSRTMELVERDVRGAVAHQGAASAPRAAARGAVRGTVARALAVGSVYMTLRDAAKAAGIAQPDYDVIEAKYYFVADDASVFTVERPGWFGWFSGPNRKYVAGPRAGQTEAITSADVAAYRREAEASWGRYIPGTLFREPRFIPGTQRRTLPLYEGGLPTGYIDESGVHRYPGLRGRMEGA
jgi:hypothetical protein